MITKHHIFSLAFLISLLVYLPEAKAHPSIALVKDSKGNIYYSDLDQIWKLSNGRKSIVVHNVHSHELFLDINDNLIGEHLWYDGDATGKYYHFLWRLSKDGKLDTLMPARQAYVNADYSLARDDKGNEYYCRVTDSLHLYKRSPAGEEEILSAHDFRGVKFFLPQPNGDLLFTKENIIYRILPNGKINIVVKNVGAKNAMLWGVWQAFNADVYAAVFNEGVIKKINKSGEITDYYRSEKGWAPAQSLFDSNNRLWVLEWSDDNKVRVVRMDNQAEAKLKNNLLMPIGLTLLILLSIYFLFHAKKKGNNKVQR